MTSLIFNGPIQADSEQVFHLPNLTEPIYTIPSIDFLPLNLSTQFTNKRQAFSETIVEILVAELGDSINHVPQLIVSILLLNSHYMDSCLT